jgi:YaiO family outer membrane protein
LSFLAAVAAVALQAAPASQPMSDYDRGVAARVAGQPEAAIDLLGRAVAADPRNADAHLQLGLSLLAAGRLDEAERALRAALEIAPDYTDARLGLARVHQRRGNRAAALDELARVPAGNTEAAQLRTALATPAQAASPYRWRLDLDGSYSDVGNGQPDWRDASIRVGYAADAATRVSGLVEASRRFSRDDVYGEVQLDRRVSDRANVWLLLGGTPNADFRPEWQVALGGGLRLTDGPTATVATLEARHSQYPLGDIQSLNPGIEQYLPGGHWLTARMINIFEDGRHQSGWLARADIAATRRLRLFAGAADAPDISEGVVTESFALFGGALLDLDGRTTLRLSINREDREQSADRLQVGAGLGLRF